MFGLYGLFVIFGTVALFRLEAQPSKALRSRAAQRSESGAVSKIAVLAKVGLFAFLTVWGMARMVRAEREGARGPDDRRA